MEVLRHNSAPVVVAGGLELPCAHVIDWGQAAATLDEAVFRTVTGAHRAIAELEQRPVKGLLARTRAVHGRWLSHEAGRVDALLLSSVVAAGRIPAGSFEWCETAARNHLL